MILNMQKPIYRNCAHTGHRKNNVKFFYDSDFSVDIQKPTKITCFYFQKLKHEKIEICKQISDKKRHFNIAIAQGVTLGVTWSP